MSRFEVQGYVQVRFCLKIEAESEEDAVERVEAYRRELLDHVTDYDDVEVDDVTPLEE